MAALTPPEDQGVVALWVGGLTADITQQDLRDAFYAYGEIAAVRRDEPHRRTQAGRGGETGDRARAVVRCG